MPVVLGGGSSTSGVNTLNDLIKELLERTSSGYQSVTSSDGGANNQIVDENIQDSYEPATSYKNSFVRMVDGNAPEETRRVGEFDPNTGTLTVGRNFSATIVASTTYQFSELLNFTDLKKCINQALSNGFLRDKEFLTAPTTTQIQL